MGMGGHGARMGTHGVSAALPRNRFSFLKNFLDAWPEFVHGDVAKIASTRSRANAGSRADTWHS